MAGNVKGSVNMVALRGGRVTAKLRCVIMVLLIATASIIWCLSRLAKLQLPTIASILLVKAVCNGRQVHPAPRELVEKAWLVNIKLL